MRRRTYLSGVTMLTAALAGCGGGDTEADDEPTNDDASDDETTDGGTPDGSTSDANSQLDPPTVAFSFDYEVSDSGTGDLTITHTSGDQVKAANLFVRGDFDGGASAGNWATDHGGSASGDVDGDPAVTAGDSVTVAAGSAYDVPVIWESGDGSSTLATDEGPDA